jgi:putative transposase
LTDGRRFRVLSVLDDFNRQLLEQAVDFSLPAARVIRLRRQLVAQYGYPQRLRTENGPEFITQALHIWCGQQEIRLQLIQPGKPTQNAFVERLHGSFSTEVLNAELVGSLADARQRYAVWQEDYNTLRPRP